MPSQPLQNGALLSELGLGDEDALPDDIVKNSNCAPAIIGDVCSQDLKLISVVDAAFEVVARKTKMPLETGDLYLLPANEHRGLRLVPLVKIMNSPQSAQNACYFYNRIGNSQKVQFVSYHFGPEARIEDLSKPAALEQARAL